MSLEDIKIGLLNDLPGSDWSKLDSALWIRLKGTDVHSSLRPDSSTHKTQIDLTYGASLPEGESPVDDFFPYLKKPEHLRISRPLTFPCSYVKENIENLTPASEHFDLSDQIRTTGMMPRNGANPSLQLHGLESIRPLLPAGSVLLLLHDANSLGYRAIGILKSEDETNLSALQKLAREKPWDKKMFGPTSNSSSTYDLARLVSKTCQTDFSLDRPKLSLLSKNFLIFTGLSGSGKSRAAKQIAEAFSDDPSHYHFAAVGPDWNNRDPLLGYPDGIHPVIYQSTPVLELLIEAGKNENQNKPYFLILDEMNLSHVERYFADFLSAMESDQDEGKKLFLYVGKQRGPIEETILIPPNFFIIGTVNIDETTYQFSPKVLDRANVIEFKMDSKDIEKFFDGGANKIEPGALSAKAGQFVDAAKTSFEDVAIWINDDGRKPFRDEMASLFNILQKFNGEFGYRTLKESSRYIYFHNAYSGIEDEGEKYRDAMDHIIIQKLLPKLHGSRSKLEGILRALLYFCENPDRENLEGLKDDALTAARETNTSLDMLGKDIIGHYELSHDKLRRMCRKLHQDQFVSFADA